jgi:hypothetical protein
MGFACCYSRDSRPQELLFDLSAHGVGIQLATPAFG